MMRADGAQATTRYRERQKAALRPAGETYNGEIRRLAAFDDRLDDREPVCARE